ncbi:GTP cyclohydrolase I FolE [Parashewanella spongiae]|uniref:GTP cyclohydrolase 1 n=1 Tax=Parashewanella spongiae TaxID=342950 RepID=A0A3A6U0B4_9GAMM|nr:GTP cyclohydrolase I FolE [Parashewanella spongiae]MCL1077034.1 GTP cyclohydrolase I FolE [Parashewanella spongiae]RJY18752.1 GTP cyclohydrolase I FolE [Parashewanella spongiae]
MTIQAVTLNQPLLSDAALKVQQALIEKGLETPMLPNTLSSEQRKEKIEHHMREILSLMALDLNDDSLADTPRRVAKMYIDEIFSGLDYCNFPKITMIDNKMNVEEMIKVQDISLTSTCEHHLVTIDGVATVAYLPRKKIIGLSKINRIVRFFAQRPQVQERLNQQVLIALQTLLETNDVAVKMDAVHYCVKSRGIMDATSSTTTSALGGIFKSDPATRAEFLMRK